MITHITGQHALSGIGRYGFELAKHIHEQHLLATWLKPYKKGHPDSYLHDYDWISGYKYKSLRNLHPYLLPYFIKFGHTKSTKSAHAHWFLSGLGAIKSNYKNVIITMHDVSLLHQSEQSSSFEQYYAKSIETFKDREIPIICVSEKAKQDAIEYAQYPEELVFAIPNGIDHEQFNTIGLEKKKLNPKFRIHYAGGLGARKNLDQLLKAFKLIQKDMDVELHIAGAHPERTPYPGFVKKEQIQNVNFTGFIPDEEMKSFYQQADLFVFPSLYEGFGFTPLEAMACGTPVLSAKGGAIEEISGGGSELFNYSVDDLVDKMKHYISNENSRNALSTRGLNWVKQYSWNKTADKTIELYNQLNLF